MFLKFNDEGKTRIHVADVAIFHPLFFDGLDAHRTIVVKECMSCVEEVMDETALHGKTQSDGVLTVEWDGNVERRDTKLISLGVLGIKTVSSTHSQQMSRQNACTIIYGWNVVFESIHLFVVCLVVCVWQKGRGDVNLLNFLFTGKFHLFLLEHLFSIGRIDTDDGLFLSVVHHDFLPVDSKCRVCHLKLFTECICADGKRQHHCGHQHPLFLVSHKLMYF